MSHHISGPRAMAESAADITDLFALPSPEQPGPAVLARTSLPAWRPPTPTHRRLRMPSQIITSPGIGTELAGS